MDEHKDEVTEYGAYARMIFSQQQIEERGHAIANGFRREGHMQGIPNKHIVVAITGQVAGLQDTRGDARRKQSHLPL